MTVDQSINYYVTDGNLALSDVEFIFVIGCN
jgi:hypothetical protein